MKFRMILTVFMTLFVGQFVTISGRVSRGNVYGSVVLEDCYVVR